MNNTFFFALLWNIIIWSFLILFIFIVNLFKKQIKKNINILISLTIWILLWIIFLWFIPEIISSNNNWMQIWMLFLSGILLFYLIELFLHTHHCKDLENNKTVKKQHENNHLMFIWTLLHNMLHWIILFSAFWVNNKLWRTMTFAILLHSIPQNISNLIMNHEKFKHVLLASLWWVLWILILFPFKDFVISNKINILTIIWWWLTYLALSDIFPNLKHYKALQKIIYLIFIFLWIWFFVFIKFLSS